MKKAKSFWKRLKEIYILMCQFFNDTASGKAKFSLNYFAIFSLVGTIIIAPCLDNYFLADQIWLNILSEIYFAFFLIVYCSCIILYHPKEAWHWITLFILSTHYISLIGAYINWDEPTRSIYLGIVTIYFIFFASWRSAQNINRKGGLIDTIVLSIGLALFFSGLISKNGQYQYYKWLIISGLILIYLYAISRALLWIFYPPKEWMPNLIKTMGLVIVYVILIIGIPFILEYATVDEQIIKDIIVPIYAAVTGGIITLAGVAWTIRFQREKDHKEEVLKCKPLFRYCGKDDIQNKEIDQTFNFTKGNAQLKNYGEEVFFFKNFTESIFEIKSIEVNGNIFTPLEYALVEKNTYFNIRFNIQSEGVLSFCMNLVDILGNPYRFELVRGEEGEITGIREVKEK